MAEYLLSDSIICFKEKIMKDPASQLKELKPEKNFFIGIDSDGCVFDSMDLKHKECFCPAFIKHFQLQPVSKFAREAWDFVNLYSSTRGCNRFLAVVKVFDVLKERKEVRQRNFKVPAVKRLRKWITTESKLGNPALEAEVLNSPCPDLVKALAWSKEVNKRVKEMVRNVSPFPFVRECLQFIKNKADVIVVSATPFEALAREWKKNKIDTFVRVIAGQEMGKKSEHIKFAAHGKYKETKKLMIGDSPGDLDAAKDNKALFYPINPGIEQDSWNRLLNEGLDYFFKGKYHGDYEQERILEFKALLPDKPPWETN